jgi:hypothetical protein
MEETIVVLVLFSPIFIADALIIIWLVFKW